MKNKSCDAPAVPGGSEKFEVYKDITSPHKLLIYTCWFAHVCVLHDGRIVLKDKFIQHQNIACAPVILACLTPHISGDCFFFNLAELETVFGLVLTDKDLCAAWADIQQVRFKLTDGIPQVRHVTVRGWWIPEWLAWLDGLFFADGNCFRDEWRITHTNLANLQRALLVAQAVFPDIRFNIEEVEVHQEKQQYFALIAKDATALVARYQSLFYAPATGAKFGIFEPPVELLNPTDPVHHQFMRGVFAGDYNFQVSYFFWPIRRNTK